MNGFLPIRGRVRSQRAVGFTLIELLVTMVVIGVLAAIMIPRVDSFRQRAHYVSIGQASGTSGRLKKGSSRSTANMPPISRTSTCRPLPGCRST